ncbi:hypothetical protein C7I87_00705 [Mesorhizobium sp. SARCC-RB16n]|uniref:hypothetical protein n=1 Tax=Mesorhizobium sp. SARCC-RB16n TaxID=2116687 RepID=UPI00122EF874|nr:hypothetical protein [Mesorhizobium sp. SARCC-RB16n]KAA3452732.1 hypothetical protein C7I87_00705 [Mesorhizobium sp. SARCC-RB16n]
MTETGFYHPVRGYWQTNGGDPSKLLAQYPEGTVVVPLKPGADYEWSGDIWTYSPPSTEALREAMPQITPRQLRLTLLSLGIHEADVDMKLVSDPTGMVEWKYATYFKRTHPLVDGLGALFSITAEQIDSLWEWAAAL